MELTGLKLGPITLPVPDFIEEMLPQSGDGGFGRPGDSYLPKPVQVVSATIEGAVRRALDFVVPEESDTPDGAKITAPLDRSHEAARALVDEHAMFGNSDRFHADDSWKTWRTEAWPLGQVLHGRIFQAMESGDWDRVENIFRDFEAYRLGDGFTGGISISPERYYDDNAWIGLAAVQAFGATNDERYLKHAERTFSMVATGQHKDGGLYWLEQDRSTRNTCSVAPAAELATRLYQATGKPEYLKFAQDQAEWLNDNLRDDQGLYLDNVRDDGHVDRAIYSYNQGAPLGLDVQLYRSTGDKKYLERATSTAKAALDYFGKHDRLWAQAPVFNAIFFRNLLALESVAPDPSYLPAIDGYLDRLWEQSRSDETGLFSEGGIGRYQSHTAGSVIDQGAIAQLYAARALPPEKWADIA